MARILVVDDEPDILLMLRMSLEDEGHEVFLAPDGAAGLERLAEHRPDLVVMLSAKSEQADIDRATELGAVEFVSKPFDLDRLVALIEHLLGA